MNVAEKKERFGQMGEELVADYFRSKKRNVEMSDNKYDMVKDMIVDGVKVEVKTENPFYIERAITIPVNSKNQLPKCLNVDRLIYVIVPVNKNSISSKRILEDDLWRWDGIEIREAPPPGERKYFYHKTQIGARWCLPIEDSKLLTYVNDLATVKDFKKFSTSKW